MCTDRSETIKLAQQLLNSYDDTKAHESALFKTMWRLVTDISGKHNMYFIEMLNTLSSYEINHTFVAISNEIMSDMCINWGRIVMLYTLGYQFAKHLVQNSYNTDVNTGEIERKFALHVGTYVADRLSDWISLSGGWGAFIELYSDQ